MGSPESLFSTNKLILFIHEEIIPIVHHISFFPQGISDADFINSRVIRDNNIRRLITVRVIVSILGCSPATGTYQYTTTIITSTWIVLIRLFYLYHWNTYVYKN